MLDYVKIINVFVRDAKFEYENGKNHFTKRKKRNFEIGL